MGNHLTCISPDPPFPTIKVFHPENGHLSELHQSIKAAELMLEHPNHFVCHSSALQTGQRITPLPADQELKLQQFYILLPMSKLHARFSSQDKVLFSTVVSHSRSSKQSKRSRSRVMPLRLDSLASERKEANPVQEHKWVSHVPARAASFQHMNIAELSGTPHLMMRSKSWIPKLETINESALLKSCCAEKGIIKQWPSWGPV